MSHQMQALCRSQPCHVKGVTKVLIGKRHRPSFTPSFRPPLLLVGQLHELALGVHAALGVDAAGVDIAGDIRIILFSSFCQVDELGFAVDVELAIDAFGVVSGGV